MLPAEPPSGPTRTRWLFAAVATTAALFLCHTLWIPAKAQLAQFLLESAWRRILAGQVQARPWPWADTHPVAELEVPALGVRRLVLAGASGRNLAFGPTALTPIDGNDLVISGHRDTHFGFLQRLTGGEVLRLRTRAGMREYRVAWREVVDSRQRQLVLDASRERLTLITCFPFDAPFGGGPLRLVVTAPQHFNGGAWVPPRNG